MSLAPGSPLHSALCVLLLVGPSLIAAVVGEIRCRARVREASRAGRLRQHGAHRPRRRAGRDQQSDDQADEQ
ncbi:hypothetical protein [Pseudonocardia sp. WMMC193]|uniref:hypothetical protein n=1 Tax=Pseudonocardia sp. WMMC193 TaxID=2911965 RepID=UPI001F2EBEFF|nr:hypothetical protein [Pseudonocardia sp. WMMC193]MCF7550499.1 hypothetical protein [Pseudonocardia sp. WMMC193]